MQATAEACQRADVRVDRGSTQVFEQIIVNVHAVQAGVAWQGLVQIREVIVDEVRKWLRWVVHARVMVGALCPSLGALIPPMVQ